MRADEIASLNRAKLVIVKHLNPADVVFLGVLQTREVLSDADVELIEKIARNRTKGDAVRKLLEIYVRKATCLEPLLEALRECCYRNLVKAITDQPPVVAADDATSDESAGRHRHNAQRILTIGRVPRNPEVFVERPDLVQELRNALLDMAKEHDGGWVIVHGMCGIGKSVLAAAVLSQLGIAGVAFTDVYWLNFGPDCGGDDDRLLLTVLGDLFTNVTKSERVQRFETVDHAIRALADAFVYDRPNALVILDDVWTENVIRAFDPIRCRVLVTTRQTDVFDVATGRKIFVYVPDSGFRREEALDAMATWSKLDSLPTEAGEIYDLTGGHPFMVSLIGSLLREWSGRWRYYREKLLKRDLSEISKHSPYKFNNFVDAAKLSFDGLPSDARMIFSRLAVFKRGAEIPSEVLSMYWNMDLIQVEDKMATLLKRSVVAKRNSNPLAKYRVHVLIHDTLASMNGPGVQKQLNTELLDHYLQISDGQWDKLPYEDGYIDQHLPYHLYRSQSPESAREILMNIPRMAERLFQNETDQLEAFKVDPPSGLYN